MRRLSSSDNRAKGREPDGGGKACLFLVDEYVVFVYFFGNYGIRECCRHVLGKTVVFYALFTNEWIEMVVGDSLLSAMGLLLQVVVLKILAAADAGARLPFPSLDIPSPLLLPSSSVSQESADIPLTTF